VKHSGIVAVLILAFGAATGTAQTPSAFRGILPPTERDVSVNGETRTESVSPASPWAGAQIGYKFGNSGDFSDSVLVTAHLMYDVKLDASDTFHLPVMGNIAELTTSAAGVTGSPDDVKKKAEDLVLSATGARVGLYPYVFLKRKPFFSAIGHGELAWKMNGFKDDANNVTYLQQGRGSIGAEFWIGQNDKDHLPITVSLTAVRSFFSAADYQKVFGKSKNHIQTFETTAIVPVGRGAGFLFEYVIGGGTRAVRAGIVIAVQPQS